MPDIGKPQGLHVAENHVGERPSFVSRGIRAEPAVRAVTLFCSGRHHNVHHCIRISGGGADPDSMGTQRFHGFFHIWLYISESAHQAKDLAFAEHIDLFHILLGKRPAMDPFPFPGNPFHLQHGPHMVAF